MSATAYLSLGSNVGDRLQNLAEAIRLLEANERISVTRVSSVYETEPVGGVVQESFLNIVAEVSTELTPQELLDAAQRAEEALGRVREVRWGPRTIDVDILLYDNIQVQTADLVLPHPEMLNRAFVLVPLAEIAPRLKLADGKTPGELAAAITGQRVVKVGALTLK